MPIDPCPTLRLMKTEAYNKPITMYMSDSKK